MATFGIDLRSLEQSSIERGIGKYVYNLLWNISAVDSVNTYYLFAYSDQSKYITTNLPHSLNFNFVFLPRPRIKYMPVLRTFYIGNPKLIIPKTIALDVMLLLDTMYPVKVPHDVKVVSVVHDLIPFLFKRDYMSLKLHHKSHVGLIILLKDLRRHQLLEKSVKSHNYSDAVIVISNATANDLNAYAGVAKSKMRIIYHGTIALSDIGAKKVSSVSGIKYLLYVGGNDPRKSIPSFTKAISSTLIKSGTSLVLAGGEFTNMKVPKTKELIEIAAKYKISDRIITPGFVSDEELAYLYQHALAFVFPSRYEGFGLPVLEAMHAGCPVIAYDNSSIPEVAGDAAILVKDGESMVPAIEQVIKNKNLREDLIRKGKKQAAKFTWEETAKMTVRVLEEVGGE